MFESFKTRERLTEIEEALAVTKRHLNRLEIEWADTLDKLKSIVGRITKDRARAEAARGEEASSVAPEAPEPAPNGGLTARQMEIQQRIINRRRHTQ